MRIRWTNPARSHLASHIAHIAADDPNAAEQVRNAIIAAVQSLSEMPYRGRPGRVQGTRELVIAKFPTYIVIYRVPDTEIRITRIWHGRQDWQREP